MMPKSRGHLNEGLSIPPELRAKALRQNCVGLPHRPSRGSWEGLSKEESGECEHGR